MTSFVGPAYQLPNTKAAIDDSVNLYLIVAEVEGKAKANLESAPGYESVGSASGAVRGTLTTNDRTFWAIGSVLYEQTDVDGTKVSRGTFSTSVGSVDFEYGTTQLVMVDGTHGYVLTLATNVFTPITDDAFYGAVRVNFLDNFFLFPRPASGQFVKTSINDATSLDALDYATAEASPDDLVTSAVVQKRLLLIGQYTTEFWRDSGAADFPFEPGGGVAEVGCMAAQTVRVLDNSAFMLGRDKNGPGGVYRLNAYAWERISKDNVDLSLQSSTDLSAATSYVYQDQGKTFYAIKAPGVPRDWVYEVKTGEWHERCDQDEAGQFIADRAVCHTYNFGRHFVGGSDGVIYRLNPNIFTKAGVPMVAQRTSPHNATPSLVRVFFNHFVLDVDTGTAGVGEEAFVELAWLDWRPGSTWSNYIRRSLGKVGERFAKVSWFANVLGSGIDRVWRLRYQGTKPLRIINADIAAEKGQT